MASGAHGGAPRGGYCARRGTGELSGLPKQSIFCVGSAERARWAVLLTKYPACNSSRPLQELGARWGTEAPSVRRRVQRQLAAGQLSCEHLAEMIALWGAQSPGSPDPQPASGLPAPPQGPKTIADALGGGGWMGYGGIFYCSGVSVHCLSTMTDDTFLSSFWNLRWRDEVRRTGSLKRVSFINRKQHPDASCALGNECN